MNGIYELKILQYNNSYFRTMIMRISIMLLHLRIIFKTKPYLTTVLYFMSCELCGMELKMMHGLEDSYYLTRMAEFMVPVIAVVR